MEENKTAELAVIMDKYEKYRLYLFLTHYLEIRDKYLEDRPVEGRLITIENLNAVMPRIIEGLELKLTQLAAQAA